MVTYTKNEIKNKGKTRLSESNNNNNNKIFKKACVCVYACVY